MQQHPSPSPHTTWTITSLQREVLHTLMQRAIASTSTQMVYGELNVRFLAEGLSEDHSTSQCCLEGASSQGTCNRGAEQRAANRRERRGNPCDCSLRLPYAKHTLRPRFLVTVFLTRPSLPKPLPLPPPFVAQKPGRLQCLLLRRHRLARNGERRDEVAAHDVWSLARRFQSLSDVFGCSQHSILATQLLSIGTTTHIKHNPD